MTENFANLAKKVDIQVKEAQTVPSKTNPERLIPRYIIIKMSKVKYKQRIFKVTRDKYLG